MDIRVTGYREVVPEQLNKDKWKELTLNTGEKNNVTLNLRRNRKLYLKTRTFETVKYYG